MLSCGKVEVGVWIAVVMVLVFRCFGVLVVLCCFGVLLVFWVLVFGVLALSCVVLCCVCCGTGLWCGVSCCFHQFALQVPFEIQKAEYLL